MLLVAVSATTVVGEKRSVSTLVVEDTVIGRATKKKQASDWEGARIEFQGRMPNVFRILFVSILAERCPGQASLLGVRKSTHEEKRTRNRPRAILKALPHLSLTKTDKVQVQQHLFFSPLSVIFTSLFMSLVTRRKVRPYFLLLQSFTQNVVRTLAHVLEESMKEGPRRK